MQALCTATSFHLWGISKFLKRKMHDLHIAVICDYSCHCQHSGLTSVFLSNQCIRRELSWSNFLGISNSRLDFEVEFFFINSMRKGFCDIQAIPFFTLTSGVGRQGWCIILSPLVIEGCLTITGLPSRNRLLQSKCTSQKCVVTIQMYSAAGCDPDSAPGYFKRLQTSPLIFWSPCVEWPILLASSLQESIPPRQLSSMENPQSHRLHLMKSTTLQMSPSECVWCVNQLNGRKKIDLGIIFFGWKGGEKAFPCAKG